MILEALVLYIYNSRYKNATSKFCCIFLRPWFHISVPDSLLLACQATRSYTINSLKLPPPKSVLELTLLVGRHWLQITHSLMMIIITMMVGFHTVGWMHEWVDIQMADEYILIISPFPKSDHTHSNSPHHDHQHQQNQRLQLIHI
jgi:hypothetical protein